ncbi:ATP binding domain-containing protein [Rozella allomycis CSF55]|uniref:GPN-loop GTPase 3 n=1 Tax=Rozella allomycis (strain CSF55) TaxID=988480 RepID=A0A075AWN0_ROZAC|nr:ATP binding domain-containing protein [Rozella allomycis CSF55]|eukprot:EPZ33082.1 ATP binding domain-containing protein [Rozella allomycis CSF55]
MLYALFVIGPAGNGKTTLCSTLIEYLQNSKRSVHLVNLDPAADYFEHIEPSIDIKDLVTVDEVMQECNYGPNGGLLYCYELLFDNVDWLQEQIGGYSEDFLIVDCPGQIELYTHVPYMKQVIDLFQNKFNYRVCGAYCMESSFVVDPSKYFSGVLCAMSAMIQLEIPYINVMTKMDLMPKDSPMVDRFLDVDTSLLLETANRASHDKYRSLNETIVRLIDDYSMVKFVPLDRTDEESIERLMLEIDNALQVWDDEEPKEGKEFDQGEDYDNDD